MARQLWNEGRVVGYSAYEIYIKQHSAVDPVNPPASERQWLSSMMAMGSSMIVKLSKTTEHEDTAIWIKDIMFPSNTLLCASNTILASLFLGECEFKGDWATKITDYGKLISNTSSDSPNGNISHNGNVPYKDINDISDTDKNKIRQYLNIIDGVVIQPGEWSDNNKKPPQKDFTPNLSDYPKLRLLIKGNIKEDIYILLTGFTIRSVVKGVSGLDSAVNTPNPENGDFLGPGQFPWANKIIFNVPTSYFTYFVNNKYVRKLPVSKEYKSVKSSNIIDMKSCNPQEYYKTHQSDANVATDVKEYNSVGEDLSVLTVYRKSDKYPPAIWGSLIDKTGNNVISPLDIVAPGSIKMFKDGTYEQLMEYERTYPGTFTLSKSSTDGTLTTPGPNGQLVPASSIELIECNYTKIDSSNAKANVLKINAGNKSGLALNIGKNLEGGQLSISPDSDQIITTGNTATNVGKQNKITPKTSNINTATILEAMQNDKAIDVLGNNMKLLKSGLDKGYIQLPNGLRLYISSTEPSPSSDIPVGSIGIGWGEK